MATVLSLMAPETEPEEGFFELISFLPTFETYFVCVACPSGHAAHGPVAYIFTCAFDVAHCTESKSFSASLEPNFALGHCGIALKSPHFSANADDVPRPNNRIDELPLAIAITPPARPTVKRAILLAVANFVCFSLFIKGASSVEELTTP
jgi:hypothetical protein